MPQWHGPARLAQLTDVLLRGCGAYARLTWPLPKSHTSTKATQSRNRRTGAPRIDAVSALYDNPARLPLSCRVLRAIPTDFSRSVHCPHGPPNTESVMSIQSALRASNRQRGFAIPLLLVDVILAVVLTAFVIESDTTWLRARSSVCPGVATGAGCAPSAAGAQVHGVNPSKTRPVSASILWIQSSE